MIYLLAIIIWGIAIVTIIAICKFGSKNDNLPAKLFKKENNIDREPKIRENIPV
jgi:hypothetical protein